MHYIAFEAGATHTLAALFDAEDNELAAAEGGPCNPTAYGWDASIAVLASLSDILLNGIDRQATVALVGMAGACNDKARREAARRLVSELRVSVARVAEDLYPILYANSGTGPALLAIGGTGSNVVGVGRDGNWVQVGGRGHVFGDAGSAYAIGISALRAVADAEDYLGSETALASALLTATGGEHTSDLIAWAGAAGKRDIAALARTVVEVADKGDAVAEACIDTQARALARQVLAAYWKLGSEHPAPVFGHGGLFGSCPRYVESFVVALAEEPRLHLDRPALRGPRAVLTLAHPELLPPWLAEWRINESNVVIAPAQPATEALPTMSRTLDALSPEEIAQAMAESGVEAARSVLSAVPSLAAVVSAAGDALRAGGRILYVGAGTSGRLGVLDASECPPTFGVDSDRVQGIIAGGDEAIVRSIEGAEDNRAAGAEAMDYICAGTEDIVVGVAASGNTPYVAGALARAAERGARTALVTSNPRAHTPAQHRVILDTGAEQLAGSTRLKAGTAAKIALNIISTGGMALAGFVHEGRMIGMRPVNAKLRERATRIVAELSYVDEPIARQALESVEWNIAAAILVTRDRLTPTAALERAKAASSPRQALGS
ncbi:MAG: hypothetical protein RLZZ303_2716 [Candidatus Hydrogenedentota bacterium]